MSVPAITPLDAPLGAAVGDFDFSVPPDEATRADLVAALDEHLLLYFPAAGAGPGPAEIEAFCSAFGDLRPTLADRSRLPDHPAINLVANANVDGVEGTGGCGEITWHSDLTFEPPLIEYLFLQAVRVPAGGGTTRWVNLCAAYEELDPGMKDRIDDLGVRYRLRQGLDFSGYFKADRPPSATSTVISLVQRNPRTGRRAVWPNVGPDFDADIVGWPPGDSADLLAELYRHVTQERFVYTHRWQEGDACLWLNTQTMHQRDAFDPAQLRILRHVNILGAADPRQLAAAVTPPRP